MPSEIRVIAYHRLLNQEYFRILSPRKGESMPKNVLDLKDEGMLSLLLFSAYALLFRKRAQWLPLAIFQRYFIVIVIDNFSILTNINIWRNSVELRYGIVRFSHENAR